VYPGAVAGGRLAPSEASRVVTWFQGTTAPVAGTFYLQLSECCEGEVWGADAAYRLLVTSGNDIVCWRGEDW